MCGVVVIDDRKQGCVNAPEPEKTLKEDEWYETHPVWKTACHSQAQILMLTKKKTKKPKTLDVQNKF